MFIVLLLCIFLISINASCNKNDYIESTTSLFQISIKNDDISSFNKLVDQNGFIIIRNFVSGGSGVRGRNIRNHYDYKSIPRSLNFQINGEIPVSLKELFYETINTKNIPKCSIKKVKLIKVRKLEPSTAEIINYCNNLLRSLDRKNDYSPEIIVLEDGLIIKEASLINEQPIGVWAIFEKSENKYFIRGIFDFR
jgi:hypothetical protein